MLQNSVMVLRDTLVLTSQKRERERERERDRERQTDRQTDIDRDIDRDRDRDRQRQINAGYWRQQNCVLTGQGYWNQLL